MNFLLDLDFVSRHGGRRLGDRCLGLGDVEVAGEARIESAAGQVERVLLALQVAVGQREVGLVPAEQYVVASDFGRQGHQGVAAGFDILLDVGGGRFNEPGVVRRRCRAPRWRRKPASYSSGSRRLKLVTVSVVVVPEVVPVLPVPVVPPAGGPASGRPTGRSRRAASA